MQSSSTATEIFYQLLDANDEEKNFILSQIASENAKVYNELQQLLEASDKQHLTSILGFNAQHAMGSELDFSGQIVDKYQITHELGRGGIGVVYAAHRADETFEQQLAIKFIQPQLTQILGKRALFSEAQLLARLNHPCIAKVFDGGEHQGCVYIVMECVEGETLDRYVQKNLLPVANKLKLFKNICLAIEHAHQNHILHADIKPENILVDSQRQPKLLDFNLTQVINNNAGKKESELVAFSREFASPEQQCGGFLTQQSDIYSLGKVLLFLFPQSPADIKAIIEKATQSEPEQRYSGMSELRNDVENILANRPVSMKQGMPLYCMGKFIQRRPVPFMSGILLIVTVGVFTATLAVQNQRLVAEKTIAENMMYEVTSMMFHSKGSDQALMSVGAMLDISRRRILSNPDLPKHIKQKLLMIMMTPTPDKHEMELTSKRKPEQ
ncbi:serine/threonine protein kinase [Photobacterium satsumensis]|uniref:serine/threonine protein kinase n=1 Tax=Photobacterium satsumensis TaxID=2910239 RepID=UPI003D11CB76